jgi:MFS family permease
VWRPLLGGPRHELMYQIENAKILLRGRGALRLRTGVSRTVLFLGLTSLFTDLSSEMVATVLPIYLVFTLGFSPLQFGLFDGLYQGAAALVRVASGMVGDRWRRHKEVAVLGYGLSAVTRIGFLLAGRAAPVIGLLIVADRTGKGIRTAPRDALISLSTPPERLGTAFGVHRALDTVGAMLGPLAAFGLLYLAPGGYDAVFVVSFCFALVGLSILLLFVENQRPETAAGEEPDEPEVSLRSVAALFNLPGFRALVFVGAALSLATMSEAFVYLGIQRRVDFDPEFFPLLYVGTALVFMILAVPMGQLADRVGRAPVFVVGYGLLLLLYVLLLLPSAGSLELVVYLLLFGAYYAATDGVLMAAASAVLPASLRGSGLALLVTATSLARLFASIVFGAAWAWFGLQTALVSFAAGLALAVVIAAVALPRTGPEAARA